MSFDELYYLDEHGRKQDARLHDAILGDDQLGPAELGRMVTLMMERGMTRETALAIYRVTDWRPDSVEATPPAK